MEEKSPREGRLVRKLAAAPLAVGLESDGGGDAEDEPSSITMAGILALQRRVGK